LGSALALIAYLTLLFYSHVHLALEAHHGAESSHAAAHDSEHNHHSDDHHSRHSAADHEMAAAAPFLGKVDPFVVHHFATIAIFGLAPTEPTHAAGNWTDDRPKHPPPRRPEQPRSPPFV
jgi:hypothetical protein